MGYKQSIKSLERRLNSELEKRRLSEITMYLEVEPNKYVILSSGLQGDKEYFKLALGYTPEEVGLKCYSLKQIQAKYNEHNSIDYTREFRETIEELSS